ncbi:MAG: type II toxin-antitoxin system RelE/ParE family toxin [Gemmataceae bacterium]|nr:type II toxin-antitoxin system RelE/ParE family toxin [Gemmataceae bacterium]
MTVVRRPQAKADLDHYAGYFTRQSGIALATRFLEAAERTFADLASLPGMGSPYPVDNPSLNGLRAFPVDGFPNHFIFYLWPSAHDIEIIRVMNASRNLAQHLESTQNDNR